MCGEGGAVNIKAADECIKHLGIIQEKEPKNILSMRRDFFISALQIKLLFSRKK